MIFPASFSHFIGDRRFKSPLLRVILFTLLQGGNFSAFTRLYNQTSDERFFSPWQVYLLAPEM